MLRGLCKHVQDFVERPSSEILLRLWIILIAPHVDLVAASGEQCRAQQTGREIDHRGRGEAQLAHGRFVGVCPPGLYIDARDVLRISFRDGRGMSGRVYFLLWTLTSFPFVPSLGIPQTTRTSIPHCSSIDLG
jgi:hypothetical protein